MRILKSLALYYYVTSELVVYGHVQAEEGGVAFTTVTVWTMHCMHPGMYNSLPLQLVIYAYRFVNNTDRKSFV